MPAGNATTFAGTQIIANGPTTFYFPNADVSDGTWSTDQGLVTGLYTRIAEQAPDDTTFDQSSVNPNQSSLLVSLPNITIIPGTYMKLHLRYSKDLLGDADILVVDLFQGSTLLQSWSLFALPVAWTEFDAVVTNPPPTGVNLQLRFTARLMISSLQATAKLIAVMIPAMILEPLLIF